MYKIALSGQMFDEIGVWAHLEAVRAFGYDAAEIRSTHLNPNITDDQKNEIHKYLEKYDIPVNCLSCFTGNYGLMTEDECANAYVNFQSFLNLAVEFKAPMMRLWPAWEASATASEEVYERAAAWIQRSADSAAKHGVRLAMEMHHGTICDTAESALKLLKMIDRENVGLILDPVNLYQVPVADVPAAIHALKDHIFEVHVKDIQKLPSDAHPGCFAYDFYAGHIGRFTKVVPPAPGREKDFYCHRRIGGGGVDWPGIFKALEEIGYDGMLAVESVCEHDGYMPHGRELARLCHEDLKSMLLTRPVSRDWHAVAPEAHGLHAVITPATHPCRVSYMYRLNLNPGETFTLRTNALEMNAVLILGSASIDGCSLKEEMKRLDSFYLPGNCEMPITAGPEGCSFFIGGAPCDGVGKPFFWPFVADQSDPALWDVHGSGSGRRDVFYTVSDKMPASRIIAGLTWGGDGAWTSWPPHQHEKDLEETYCYFDIDEPRAGMHLNYRMDEPFQQMRADVVNTGHFMLAPEGYHPTVSTPGTRNAYFWVLCAFSHSQRSYNLAVTDPALS